MVRCAGTILAPALLLCSIIGWAQNPSPPTPTTAQSQQNPAPDATSGQFTIRAVSRVVLSDVMVVDNKGNPIHGLPREAFRVYDNKQLQKIDFFQEHTVEPGQKYLPAAATGSPNTFSNAYLKTLPPVVNVVVIDIANLGIVDQMYLYAQLQKFFNDVPPSQLLNQSPDQPPDQHLDRPLDQSIDRPLDQPIAIYLRAGSGCFLIQDFTADRTLLLKALRRAIPRLPPHGRNYLTDVDTINRLAYLLDPLQGRKNVLWFSGGSTQFWSEAAQLTAYDTDWRVLYDELERERIALYPIDARGLTGGGSLMIRQHMAMQDMAHATGGQAIYNNNGLKEAAAHLMDADRSYYTLTYAPHDFKEDSKYHKIRIELADGSHYRLSYREGYFADGSKGGIADLNNAPKPRERLLANGQTLTEPDLHRVPIIFQARLLEASSPELTQTKPLITIQPAPARKKSKPYVIRYTVPAEDLSLLPDGDQRKMLLNVASIELSEVGTLIGKRAEQIRFTLPRDAKLHIQGLSIVIDQPVNLIRDDKYLYLAVWDPTNQRTGTLQTPIEIPK